MVVCYTILNLGKKQKTYIFISCFSINNKQVLSHTNQTLKSLTK